MPKKKNPPKICVQEREREREREIERENRFVLRENYEQNERDSDKFIVRGCE